MLIKVLIKILSAYNRIMAEHRKRVIVSALVLSYHFLKTISEEDSDSDNEEIQLNRLEAALRLRDPQNVVRIENYVECTLQRISDEQFRQHFRITRRTFIVLENRLAPILIPVSEEGRPRIDVRKQLLSSLWLLATPDSYRSVGERFNLGKSSLNHCFQRVVDALNVIADDVITWPTGRLAFAAIEKFRRLAQLPNVIGAIDGTHIEIKAPKVDAQFYITRKKRFAITLQAVCDANLRFTDCFAGFAGSVGDLRIFRNSDLWMEVRRHRAAFFTEQQYIIGDKAYPVLSWCIPPYRNLGNMTQMQRNFNRAHAQTRQVIERAFALLGGRFRRLKYLDMNRDDQIPYVILACCVLHNLCLDDIDENVQDFVAEGHVEVADLGNVDEGVNVDEHQEDGLVKRNNIAATLMAER